MVEATEFRDQQFCHCHDMGVWKLIWVVLSFDKFNLCKYPDLSTTNYVIIIPRRMWLSSSGVNWNRWICYEIDMLSSRQRTQLGTYTEAMYLFNTSIISSTSQIQSRNAGGFLSAKSNCQVTLLQPYILTFKWKIFSILNFPLIELMAYLVASSGKLRINDH